MRFLKSVLTLSALLGLAAPAFAKAPQKDFGRPGAFEVSKKKKEIKKEESEKKDADGSVKKEEKTEKTEETKPQM